MQKQGKIRKGKKNKKIKLENSVPGTGSDGSQATAAPAEFTALPHRYPTTASSSTASGSIRFSNENRQHQHQHRYQHELLFLLLSILGPTSHSSRRVLLLPLLLSRCGGTEVIHELCPVGTVYDTSIALEHEYE